VPGVDLPVLPADLGPGVRAAFTTRAGGVSTGAWAGLDLGLHVGDDPDRVRENRGLLAGWMGAPVWFGRQVHGTRVALLVADQPPVAEPAPGDPTWTDLGQEDGGYDALVTITPRLALGVLVADCVPVLLADPRAGVVATAHAGRGGLLSGVLGAVVGRMIDQGAQPERIRASLGPSVGGCCYEVPVQIQAEACDVLPQARATTRWGTPALDLRAGCRASLEAAGVSGVDEVGGCTIEDGRFYSYRRAQVTGRFAGVVMMLG
jgi:polyphenol oxidase